MTEREQRYIEDCHTLLSAIQQMKGDNYQKAVCINALSAHLREHLGMWTKPKVESPDKVVFLVGLTFADLIQLQNGGTIEVNPKDAGLLDMPTTIFLGGTEEHMGRGLAKHPNTPHKFTDTHRDKKN